MRFKVYNHLSACREVKGGSPQGTKIGNFLFIATIDNIEDVPLQDNTTVEIDPDDSSSNDT